MGWKGPAGEPLWGWHKRHDVAAAIGLRAEYRSPDGDEDNDAGAKHAWMGGTGRDPTASTAQRRPIARWPDCSIWKKVGDII